MQDFTKPIAQNVQALPTLNTAHKKGFIEARKNKDNFWNLMFGLGMVIGWFITIKLIKPYPVAALVSAGVTMLSIPLLIRHFSKVSFIDNKFFSQDRRELKIPEQMPNGFFVVATTTIAVIILGNVSDNMSKTHPTIFNLVFLGILLTIFFFIPVIFFILKNCPISILFTWQYYKQNIRFSNSFQIGHTRPSRNKYGSHATGSMSGSWATDPTKYYIPGNVYHNRH